VVDEILILALEANGGMIEANHMSRAVLLFTSKKFYCNSTMIIREIGSKCGTGLYVL